MNIMTREFVKEIADKIENLGADRTDKVDLTIMTLLKMLEKQFNSLIKRVDEIEEISSQVYQIPRGERADFLKITVTLPSDLLAELKSLGIQRKAAKMKDTDTSSLIREAIIEFLNKEDE